MSGHDPNAPSAETMSALNARAIELNAMIRARTLDRPARKHARGLLRQAFAFEQHPTTDADAQLLLKSLDALIAGEAPPPPPIEEPPTPDPTGTPEPSPDLDPEPEPEPGPLDALADALIKRHLGHWPVTLPCVYRPPIYHMALQGEAMADNLLDRVDYVLDAMGVQNEAFIDRTPKERNVDTYASDYPLVNKQKARG